MTAKTPNHPAGTVHGSNFADTGDPFGLKLGIITRVDEVNLKADVKIITGGGSRYEIDLTQAMCGPRSFWGGVPEVNSLVILGYRKVHKRFHNTVILGYIPVGNRSGLSFDPFSSIDPNDTTPEEAEVVAAYLGRVTRYKRMLLRPGDVGGMSSSGAEIALTKDVLLYNRAGDSIELRDSDRTLVTQALHRMDSAAGVRLYSGPTRRGDQWFPPDIFKSDGVTVQDEGDRYYGRDNLQATGPIGNTIVGSDGKFLDVINSADEFPPVTFSNSRRAFYAGTRAAVSLETRAGLGMESYVERRLEISHTTDLVQEVLSEIDGFASDLKRPYIEQVMGTLVGSEAYTSTMGMRQYGRVLRPYIFQSFQDNAGSILKLEEVDRNPAKPDIEVETLAGAYLFRIYPPQVTDDNVFGVAVSKQGKLFVNIPGSKEEKYHPGTKNVSVEAALGGAVKAVIGSATPDALSGHITCAGGLRLELGADAVGNSLTVIHHGAIKWQHASPQSDDGVTQTEEISGTKQIAVDGTLSTTVEGTLETVASGQHSMKADRMAIQAFGGLTQNCGEFNQLVSGKSQFNYAMAVVENIVLGGKLSTILAGGRIENVAAGAVVQNVLGGATTCNCAAGAYTVSVGTGAVSVATGAGAVALSTAAGAMSLAAAAGAVAVTAGMAINMTAAVAVSMIGAQILLGGPAAVFGVCRGAPMHPPGSMSLDWITGLPLQGCAVVRSF